ncbi:MAG: glycosyltransferase [Pirellulaceae bacterium]|nr:glycosyltransferase [Pirellulaceae bacterium]
MKLLFLSSGKTVPATRFRTLQFVPHLRAAGHQCVVAHSFPQKYDHYPWLGFRPSQWLKRANRYLDLFRAAWGDFDAIILERELFNDDTLDLERRFRRIAKKLVLDIDDAVFVNFPSKLESLATMADLVLAGNDNLIEWARQFNSNVLSMPTCIDTDAYARSRKIDRRSVIPVVGWIGTSSNAHYLQLVDEALMRTAQVHDFQFHVVSNSPACLDSLRLKGVQVQYFPWSERREQELLAQFDIGIMPLHDDQWSRYKCGAKLLQYMAMAIPGIASPVGVNSQIVKHAVNGYLATSSEEWFIALSEFISDESRRRQLGQAGLRTVEESYSVSAHLPRWIGAVESLINLPSLNRYTS